MKKLAVEINHWAESHKLLIFKTTVINHQFFRIYLFSISSFIEDLNQFLMNDGAGIKIFYDSIYIQAWKTSIFRAAIRALPSCPELQDFCRMNYLLSNCLQKCTIVPLDYKCIENLSHLSCKISETSRKILILLIFIGL
jgi:hypothetical protein